jgi:hypothetical protein
MEATGQIAQLDKTTGADGKSRKRGKPKGKSGGKGKAITGKLVVVPPRWETLQGGQWDWHDPEISEWQRSAGL